MSQYKDKLCYIRNIIPVCHIEAYKKKYYKTGTILCALYAIPLKFTLILQVKVYYSFAGEKNGGSHRWKGFHELYLLPVEWKEEIKKFFGIFCCSIYMSESCKIIMKNVFPPGSVIKAQQKYLLFRQLSHLLFSGCNPKTHLIILK